MGGKSSGPSFFAGAAFGLWVASLGLLFGLLHEHAYGHVGATGA